MTQENDSKMTPGQRMSTILKSVARFHSDTSKLLVDCDKHVGKGRRSVFGNFATKELTYHVKADFWMPEGMYRYYEVSPSLVDGVSITFFNRAAVTNPELETEPLFKTGRIKYRSSEASGNVNAENGEGKRVVCDCWDIWSLYFQHGNDRPLGKLLEYSDVAGGRIVWACIIAVPLLSITRIEDVLELTAQLSTPPK